MNEPPTRQHGAIPKQAASATMQGTIPHSLPVARWLPNYQREWLSSDLMAGATLAAYLLPASIGDASLAGLPPEAGLYACLFSGLVFWLFCSSRHTVITVTSAISLLIGSTLGELSGGDTARFAQLAATTAVLIAAIAWFSWLVRAGAIVRFISEGVMVGFKCGVALFLASTQLPKLCGFHGSHGDFWKKSGHFLTHLHETNAAALAIGGAALAILVVGRIWFSNKPVAMVVVAAGIVVSSWFALDTRGVKLLGEVPQGLPGLSLPTFERSQLNQLIPLAVACFLLGAVETAAIGRMFIARHGGRFDANQEFLALAAANLAAGLGQGLPVSGGMSQSVVNEGGGARTPLSGVIAAGVILLVVVYFSRSLEALPQPVLAAIVLVAVAGLFNLSALIEFWRGDRVEFAVATAAFLGVLGSGLLRGVLIGAILSLILLLRRASQPHVALLGRIPGSQRFTDCERHPDNERIPGVVICRPESSVLYFNVDHICDLILARTQTEAVPPQLVVLDLSNAAYVDLQGAHSLAHLARELQTSGIRLQTVEAHAAVRDRFRHEGVDPTLGGLNRFATVSDVVRAFQDQTHTVAERDAAHDQRPTQDTPQGA